MKSIADSSYLQETPHITGICAHCNMEIYAGEDYYFIDGDLVHEDCLRSFSEDYFRDFLVRV